MAGAGAAPECNGAHWKGGGEQVGIREVISSELAMIGGELSVRLIRQRIEASWSPHPWRHSVVQCSAVQCSAEQCSGSTEYCTAWSTLQSGQALSPSLKPDVFILRHGRPAWPGRALSAASRPPAPSSLITKLTLGVIAAKT